MNRKKAKWLKKGEKKCKQKNKRNRHPTPPRLFLSAAIEQEIVLTWEGGGPVDIANLGKTRAVDLPTPTPAPAPEASEIRPANNAGPPIKHPSLGATFTTPRNRP